jgi:hypothetical protein
MIILTVAALLFAFLLWSLFGLAMGLRESKRVREAARAAEERSGRRVVAEIPLADGVVFFTEDAGAFAWGAESVPRAEVSGARMLLNGAVMAMSSRPGASLPAPPAAEEYEGRERWDVILYLADGRARVVPCGTLREGVSREIAARVFAAVGRA